MTQTGPQPPPPVTIQFYRQGTRENEWEIFGVTFIVADFNPGRGTFQWDKGIVSRRKPVLGSPNAQHKAAAAAGLWLEHQCGPQSSHWEGCKLRPTPSQGSASTLKNREPVKERATMNT